MLHEHPSSELPNDPAPPPDSLTRSSGGHAKTTDSRGLITTAFVVVLTLGAVGLSVVASALGHREFSWELTQWMADAGGVLKQWILGVFGVYGTVVIAMVADASISRDRRPNSLGELQRQTLLSFLALVIGVSSTYLTVLICWYLVMHNSADAPSLLAIAPMNIVIVALAIMVASSARPTLPRERQMVKRDLASTRTAQALLDARMTRHPWIVLAATWFAALIIGASPAIGSRPESGVFIIANSLVTGTTWFVITLLLALSAWPDPSPASRWGTVAVGVGLGLVFGTIAVSIGVESGPRGIVSAVLIIVVPALSAALAPRPQGSWRWAHSKTLGSAAAWWGDRQLQESIERLDERLVDLEEEAAAAG